MIRYLLNVSYIGTAFRGVTYIEPYYKYRDLRTIQGALENAVKFFFKKRCEVCCSSRTDARVHALESMFHVDVDQNGTFNATQFDDEKYRMIASLNENLRIHNASIRVNDVDLVDKNTFMAYRNVESRTYLYRIAVPHGDKPNDQFTTPIELVDRCFVVEDCDLDALKKAANLFVGRHDFRSFMRYSKENKTKESCYAQRMMFSIKIEQSSMRPISLNNNTHFQFYDIIFTANSYVYRQIRRMVGALCAVAQGRITDQDIYELLTIPSYSTWDHLSHQNKLETAPACGLYFIGINYKSKEDWKLERRELTVRGTRIKSYFRPRE